ncbi:MAG TPA: DoxX family protein [Bacteroidota bacterium]|nr:DoxX family protein [Bacteroidota bacterium]
MKLSTLQIFLLRIAIGALFLNLGLEKYHEGWLSNPQPLTASLQKYFEHAGGMELKYLTSIAIPYAPVWARLMTIGELAIGASFLLGLLTRFSAGVALFMILNFHAANGLLFGWGFFGSPYAALLFSGLLACFLARAGRWVGVDWWLAGINPKSWWW